MNANCMCHMNFSSKCRNPSQTALSLLSVAFTLKLSLLSISSSSSNKNNNISSGVSPPTKTIPHTLLTLIYFLCASSFIRFNFALFGRIMRGFVQGFILALAIYRILVDEVVNLSNRKCLPQGNFNGN